MEPSTNKIIVSDRTVSNIQDLIRINIDSYKGFEKAAECVEHVDTKVLFLDIAQERSRFAQELQGLVAFNHEDPEDDGSFKAKMHRWWIGLKSIATDGDRHAMLSEAERGEDKIKALYEELTPETAASPAYQILARQLDAVRRAHDRVKALRDASA